MERTMVESSNLRSVGYDPVKKVLEIEFQSGGIYQYSDVPEEEYAALMKSESHGRYFLENIKEGYAFRRIN